MIILEFVYKGSPVSVISFPELEFTESAKELIVSMMKHGMIKKPENWDRFNFYPSHVDGFWRG